ncbi:MAG: SDR family NAD(P)-dependent oxidoreductase [Acidimicrobiales bacterium]
MPPSGGGVRRPEVAVRVLLTGASSGFGRTTAARLAASPGVDLVVGGRRAAPVGTGLPLDLSSLSEVRSFAESVEQHLAGRPLDGLILNAGVVRGDVAGRTEDGFETAFAVNHLAHYLLLRLLMPRLGDGAVIVMTTSGTHDPTLNAGLEAPRHADVELLAHPERDPALHPRPGRAGQHAYSASKLCTVLTVRALAERAETVDGRWSVVAYDPGQVFGTGLVSDLSLPRRMAWAVFGTPLGAPVRHLSATANDRRTAGLTLARLALGERRPPPGRSYAALRRGRLGWPEPSELARQPGLAATVWDRSAELVGLV